MSLARSKIVLYYHRCPFCGKYIVGLSRSQLEYNAIQHYIFHKRGLPEALDLKYKVVELE